MSAGADSIRPFAIDFAPEAQAAARAVAELRDSFFPRAPELARHKPKAKAKSPEVAVARPAAPAAPFLTAVAFRPDGGKALALELTLLRCFTLAVGVVASLGGALALGWAIGEWTARL